MESLARQKRAGIYSEEQVLPCPQHHHEHHNYYPSGRFHEGVGPLQRGQYDRKVYRDEGEEMTTQPNLRKASTNFPQSKSHLVKFSPKYKSKFLYKIYNYQILTHTLPRLQAQKLRQVLFHKKSKRKQTEHTRCGLDEPRSTA